MILLNVTSFRVFKLNWYKSHIDLNNSHVNLINSHFNLIFLYFNLIMLYIWIDRMYLTPHNERSLYSCTFPPPHTMKHWNIKNCTWNLAWFERTLVLVSSSTINVQCCIGSWMTSNCMKYNKNQVFYHISIFHII